MSESIGKVAKTHHLMELPEGKFDFTDEERTKVDEVWELTSSILKEPDLISRYARWMFQKLPTYVARPDLSQHNSHLGYVYAIHDPRIQSEKNIIFIGSSPEPWVAVSRHLKRSQNKHLRAYVKEMLLELRSKSYIFWRGKEVAAAWEDDIELPPASMEKEGGTEIPWSILGLYRSPEELERYLKSVLAAGGTLADALPNWSRNEWVERMLLDGHPVLNGLPGRRGNDQPWLRKEKEEAVGYDPIDYLKK